MNLPTLIISAFATTALLGCQQESISIERYTPIDNTAQNIENNIQASPELTSVISIDHSRLASAAGKPFPPTKVVMFQDRVLEAHILALDSRLALNLPLKVLVYENERHEPSVVWNSPDYLEHRFNVHFSRKEEARFHYAIASALEGVPPEQKRMLTEPSDDTGIITIPSKLTFEQTKKRALDIIRSNEDVTVFDIIDYQTLAKSQQVVIPKTTLIMYGSPAPGGAAMKGAQTLGLDAFPQKFLIWQDKNGNTFVSYNDIAALADRQGVHKSLGLYLIKLRIGWSFYHAFD